MIVINNIIGKMKEIVKKAKEDTIKEIKEGHIETEPTITGSFVKKYHIKDKRI